MSDVIIKIDNNTLAEDVYKKITVKDEIIYKSRAWNYVSKETLVNCWIKAKYAVEEAINDQIKLNVWIIYCSN